MDKKYQMKSLADADVQKQLKNASPLDMVQTLQSIELHNQQSSIKVIDDIYKEFEGGGSTVETLLKPLVTGVIDSGIAKKLNSGKGKKKISLPSGTEFWGMVENFSYTDILPPGTSGDGNNQVKAKPAQHLALVDTAVMLLDFQDSKPEVAPETKTTPTTEKPSKKEVAAAEKDSDLQEVLAEGAMELLKVSFYEVKDMILCSAAGKDEIPFSQRMQRVADYLKQNVLPKLKGELKTVLTKLTKNIRSYLESIFNGFFKKFIDIVAAGFDAIVEAFHVIRKPSSEMTPAEKSDAILKIFIAAVTPVITTFVLQLPLGPFEEIGEAVLGGIISSILIWAVDKADIFNTKADRRSQRVKEVFEYRVQQIKQNVDVFDHNATQAFIQQRAAFDGMRKQISEAVDNNRPVHELSTNLADFMGVGEKIKIRDTDSFAELLASNRQLTI